MNGGLADGVVDIWIIDLDDAASDGLPPVLNREEEARAGQFRTVRLQQHFRRCRSALRRVLAQYTGQAAAGVALRYTAYGKPELAEGGLQFNVSHSGQHALIAVSREAIGVDLEWTAYPGFELAPLIDLVCHAREKAQLDQLDGEARFMLFHRIWTQKEAYCKALGLGLQEHLRAFHTEAIEGTDLRLICGGQPAQLAPHYVYGLNVPPGYAASLCAPRAGLQIRMHPPAVVR
jgi:4'-phosphopantetheinyl transferase